MTTPAIQSVLLVSGVYPPAVGGPSLQTKHIAQQVIARNISAQVVTYGDPRLSGILDGIPVTFLDGIPRTNLWQKLWRNWQIWGQLHQILRDEKPSLIHMQTAAGNLALMTGILARLHGIPSLLKYTADLVPQNADLEKFTQSGDKLISRRKAFNQSLTRGFQGFLFWLYTGIWATTPTFQGRLIQDHRVMPEKVFFVPNFINLEPFQSVDRCSQFTAIPASPPHPPQIYQLLTVARLFPVKGLDVYLRALAQLQDLSFKARIVGSGSLRYQRQLQTLIQDLQLGDRVELTGAIEPEQVASLYGSADVFVLPSRHEPFGIVLLEAMAAGVPIVATQVDGVPWVVAEGLAAALVPPNDPDSLAATLRHLLQTPAQRQTLAAAGRRRAQAFTLATGVQHLLAIYQTLAARASSPGVALLSDGSLPSPTVER